MTIKLPLVYVYKQKTTRVESVGGEKEVNKYVRQYGSEACYDDNLEQTARMLVDPINESISLQVKFQIPQSAPDLEMSQRGGFVIRSEAEDLSNTEKSQLKQKLMEYAWSNYCRR